jgi:hypothetical protein
MCRVSFAGGQPFLVYAGEDLAAGPLLARLVSRRPA